MTSSGKTINAESIWGGYYIPDNLPIRAKKGLRVVVFGSAIGGQMVLESLIRFELKYPDLLNIVGLATDDPADQKARISLKKRIWSNYTPVEGEEIRNRIIARSLQAGIPCYTGKVKTDYFRQIYFSWNPDLLIMNCFGQRLDGFLYEYPPFGAFNFHPSNLACNIGIGAQPFQELMHQGLNTSPIVIHKVTEIIDGGPVVGISPEINIRLKDGSYPSSIIPLLLKINSISGWMTIDLLLEILARSTDDKKGTLTALDFDKTIPDTIRRQLLEPVSNDVSENYELPLHPKIL
jgi:hypothetical protein